MTDTVIKGTGNSRNLKSVSNFLTLYPTYQSFAQALINGTLPVDILGLNSAGVQTSGTALNKANLLKDATASLLGLSSSAVPDDAFRSISKNVNTGWKLLREYKTAGTYTWTAPNLFSGQSYEIGVLVIGAGGSGAARGYESGTSYPTDFATGGASGFCIYFIASVSPNSTHNLVVGSKGLSVSISGSSPSAGNNGGSSSFDGIVAYGGRGGSYSDKNATAYGAQVPFLSIEGIEPYGGTIRTTTDNPSVPMMCYNPFESKRILGAGGNSCSPLYGTAENMKGGKNPITKKGGGNGAYGEDTTATATSADEEGCGGGGATTKSSNRNQYKTATSGSGADGAVKIYVRGVST